MAETYDNLTNSVGIIIAHCGSFETVVCLHAMRSNSLSTGQDCTGRKVCRSYGLIPVCYEGAVALIRPHVMYSMKL